MRALSALPDFRRNTKYIGKISELAVMRRIAEMGCSFSIPFGDDAPYDLVVETADNRLLRVQVKHGRIRNGVLKFGTVSSHAHRKSPPTRYDGRIDAFAVYCSENDGLYIIDVHEVCVSRSHGWLRLEVPRNNMRRGIHWASDFIVERGESPKLFSAEASNSGALDGD